MSEKRSAQSDTLDTAIEEGMARHRAGDHSEAETIYRRVLQADPEHPDALHLLGLIAYQRGRNEDAVESIRRANSG